MPPHRGVAAAAGGDALAGDEHARTDHGAGVDQIAHHVVVPPDAPRSRTVVTPVSSVVRAFARASSTVSAGSRRGWPSGSVPDAVPVVGHVRVRVDRGPGSPCSGGDRSTRRRRHARACRSDALDPIAVDDDDGAGDELGAVPDSSETHRFDGSGSRGPGDADDRQQKPHESACGCLGHRRRGRL